MVSGLDPQLLGNCFQNFIASVTENIKLVCCLGPARNGTRVCNVAERHSTTSNSKTSTRFNGYVTARSEPRTLES
jgi:hypothetical protein